MDTRKPYTIDEGGVAHTYLLDDEMARAWNLEQPDVTEPEVPAEPDDATDDAEAGETGETGVETSDEDTSAEKQVVPKNKQASPEKK